MAVEIYRSAYGADSPLVAHPLGIRGETLGFLGRYEEAERDLRRAVNLSTAWVGADHPWTAYPLTALGKTLISEGRWRAATSVLGQALRIRARSEPNAELLGRARFALARARWEAGEDRAETRALATAARDAYRNLPEHGTQVGKRSTLGWPRNQNRLQPGRLTGRGTVAAGQRRSFWASLGSRHREDGRGAFVSGERTPEQGTSV